MALLGGCRRTFLLGFPAKTWDVDGAGGENTGWLLRSCSFCFGLKDGSDRWRGTGVIMPSWMAEATVGILSEARFFGFVSLTSGDLMGFCCSGSQHHLGQKRLGLHLGNLGGGGGRKGYRSSEDVRAGSGRVLAVFRPMAAGSGPHLRPRGQWLAAGVVVAP